MNNPSDHGLPDYNTFTDKMTFDLPAILPDQLAEAYNTVDDIDLFVGGYQLSATWLPTTCPERNKMTDELCRLWAVV